MGLFNFSNPQLNNTKKYKDMKTQIITSAYQEMLKTAGSRKAESGGLLLGSRKDYVVQYFLFDKDAETTGTSYTFNAPYLNEMLQKLWDEQKLELLGFFHTHPTKYKQLSPQDKKYFKEQFKHIKVDKFLTPLMFTAKDGEYDFIPFVVHRNGEVEKTTLEILPDDYSEYATPQLDVDGVRQTAELILEKVTALENQSKVLIESNEEITEEDSFVFFLNNFPFKKFRIFLFSFFLLVFTIAVSVFLLDLFFYFSFHKLLK